MRTTITLFSLVLFLLLSCEKENSKKDYRDEKVGIYKCTSIRKFVVNDNVYFENDTFSLTISKSETKDSIILLSLFEEDLFLKNDSFFNVSDRWPRIFGFFIPLDSVKFEYIPGLGPEHVWYKGKKQ